MISLHYGLDHSVDLDIAADALVAHCLAPRGDTSTGSMAAARQIFDQPIGFPPLSRSAVPGDKVVLALEPGVPESDAIVAAVVQCLTLAGAMPEDVTVLRTSPDREHEGTDPRQMLPPETRAMVKLETHDPDERGHLGYLANTRSGRPIYLNRTLCDADLIVLVGSMRPAEAVTYHGSQGGLYPMFSDAQTQRRFRHPGIFDSDADVLVKARSEVKRVGWLAGTQFTVQVIPGADDTALAILAGEPEAVDRAGRQRCDEAWAQSVPQRASLVVAGITGGDEQQTWENVGRALAAAMRVVDDDGVIALCTDLSSPPGPALAPLVNADDPHAALEQVRKKRLADAFPATELAEALQRARVYLLSRLDEDVVEELGIAAVTDPSDLGRLARRHSSCIVLSDAQFMVPSVVGETDE